MSLERSSSGFEPTAGGWSSRSGVFVVDNHVRDKRSAFVSSLCEDIDAQQEAAAGTAVLDTATLAELCEGLDILVTAEKQLEFKLELNADGTQATTADFQNWWDSNTALKALAKVDYARNLLTSYKDVDEDDGGEDEAPEVPAAATGGRKRAKTVTFTEPDESDDDDEVAEPEPAPPAAADDEKPPQARMKRARLGSKAGYELEKLRATKEAMSLGLVSEADYKLMKAAFLGMEDEATSMDKKDVAEDLKVQKEMEADGRPLWFQRVVDAKAGFIECVFCVQRMLGIGWEVEEDSKGRTHGDIVVTSVKPSSPAEGCGVVVGWRLLAIGSGSDSLSVDGKDFDICMKQVMATRSFEFPLVLTLQKQTEETFAKVSDKERLMVDSQENRSTFYRYAAKDLMPGALHAGWVRIEEKAANGYPSFKRAFAILWRDDDLASHKNAVLIVFKTPESVTAKHVYFLKPGAKVAKKAAASSFKIGLPKTARKNQHYTMRIDGAKTKGDVDGFKLVVAGTTASVMRFWEAALHGLMNGFDNPKIKAYIEELKRSLVNEYFGETERMF